MAGSQDPLLEDTRTRLASISATLDGRLEWLKAQGLLTKLDGDKLRTDAMRGGQAVVAALERRDYPEEMRRELVDRLIVQFEHSVENILSNAEGRLLTDVYMENRLNHIDHAILNNMGLQPDSWLAKYDKRINAFHQSFKKALRSSLATQPRDVRKIDRLFESYASQFEKLVDSTRPLLPHDSDYQTSPTTDPEERSSKSGVGDQDETEITLLHFSHDDTEEGASTLERLWRAVGSFLALDRRK